ncbi:exo-rhamnogalacturonase B [Emericellopsis atlantica]|uniref:Exo-rhamnogalacturonase B n=1 Tax=Emericellopsis atlantica TaxID=2614577 RepID=A0A9P8CLC9_9HYPO|nr:exo-rhamnogalacturonase B [Emericellopsis atlantica]KAG9251489.1 exo-rhamnogalacturonase B [Emericellopsis atlantica]
MLSLFFVLPLAAASIVNSQLSLLPHHPHPPEDIPPLSHWEDLAASQNRTLCHILPGQDGDDDDAKTIASALNHDCRTNALVVLPGAQYTMASNITTTSMDNVHIELYGRLLWTTDIDYWLSVSMPVGFQNQSTVWYFGGRHVRLDGHGTGELNGNGQVWYDWAKGRGNLPHRPMMINWRHLHASVITNLRFVQAQMWTMATTWSHDLLFDTIYVNNTSNSSHSTLNTDGIDTIYSDNITLRRWDVTCGDDNVALKGNSSNVFLYDSVFHGGQVIAIGSLGQYNDAWEYVHTFHARNVTMRDTRYAVYLKTWAGHQNGYPPNGGGGGRGHGQDIVLEDVVLHGARTAPFWIWQCENYEGDMGKDCDSSEFSFSDLRFSNVSGTTADGVTLAASLRCAAGGGGCTNIIVEDFSVVTANTKKPLTEWYCANVHNPSGFECEPFPEDKGDDE